MIDYADMDGIVRHYREHGYVVIPDLLSPEEAAELRAVTDALEDAATASGGETPVYDFTPGPGGAPVIERIKKPHRADPYYWRLAQHPRIVAVLARLIGPDIRLSHSKINMKHAQGGAALEWHQDWAFAPHTHMGTAVASLMIDGARAENGAMQVLAGSNHGPLIEHHGADGFFDGALDPAGPDVHLDRAALLAGPPGTVAFHHPLTIHGSGVNSSGDARRILFLEYAAADAYPLFYTVDPEDYEARMIAGTSGPAIRVEANPVKLPQPSRSGSSIYKIQAGLKSRFFADAAG